MLNFQLETSGGHFKTFSVANAQNIDDLQCVTMRGMKWFVQKHLLVPGQRFLEKLRNSPKFRILFRVFWSYFLYLFWSCLKRKCWILSFSSTTPYSKSKYKFACHCKKCSFMGKTDIFNLSLLKKQEAFAWKVIKQIFFSSFCIMKGEWSQNKDSDAGQNASDAIL